MAEKKEIIGYYTNDGNIYWVECINKGGEIMKKIDQAITAKDTEKSVYFREGSGKEIK